MSGPRLDVVRHPHLSPVACLRIPAAGWRLCDEFVGTSHPRRFIDWQHALSQYEAPPACATCLWCMALWLKLWRT